MAVQSRDVKADRLASRVNPYKREPAGWLGSRILRGAIIFLPALCVLLFECYRDVISPGASSHFPGLSP